VGARISLATTGGSQQLHSANTHLVIFVQPFARNNETYLVDVGHGPSNLIRPLLLSTDPNNFVYGMTETERHRLVFEPLQESSLGQFSSLFQSIVAEITRQSTYPICHSIFPRFFDDCPWSMEFRSRTPIVP
jgi:arylamine N-acetyltransferase